MSTVQPWFALQTKSKNEKKTARLLGERGYECFTPTCRLKRKWSDRTVEIDFPLFPGYIFCRFSPSVLGKAISTQGVIRIVGFGGKPAEVAVEEIEALQLLTQSNLLREPWQYLPHGTLVLVETGPMAGAQGFINADGTGAQRFMNADGGRKQLIISVTLLQRSVAVHLNEDTLISVITDLRESRAKFTSESYLAAMLLKRT